MEEHTGTAIRSPTISQKSSDFQHLIGHEHTTKHNLRKLYISMAICALFMTAEIIGGIISGSLAILTDAAHILSDILGFGISVISIHITRLPASRRMSFGFHRAEVLGALMSIAAIWGLTAWLVSEAIHRIIHLSHVDGEVMVLTAVAGLVGNLVMIFILGHHHNHIGHNHEHEHHGIEDSHHHECHNHEGPAHKGHHHHGENLNMRAAVLHVIGDVLQSAGVIIAGCIIYFFPHCSVADPICTLLFSIIVMFTTVPIVKSCITILMEATPETIDSFDIEQDLRNIESVTDLHELHVWSISSGKVSLSVHLVGQDSQNILQKAQKLLKDKYGIFHSTIQIELDEEKGELDCLSNLHE